nr:uncharacterized protein LOC109150426 [Ipomoea batatas]
MGKIESQRSVFDRLGSNPQAPKRKSIHDRLGVGQDVKNNASHPVEAEPSKRPRSMIPSRMRREIDIHISCGEMLKVQPRTIVHTRAQKWENEESVGSSDDVAPPQGEEASSFHITLCDEIPIEGEDAEEAPHELEKGVRAAIDELKEVDLGTPENPRPIFISTLLSNEDEKIYVELLKEYIDVFAWTYKEMPRLDPKVVVHRLAVKKTCRPVKQAQRRFCPELIPSIEGEVNKLIEAGFIREVKYPTWISSIVPVRKKNGQIRVCVDFRDLNVACPNDDFPLPITELMIDAIRMALEDEELTAFRTPKGIYCYKVMLFGLKNAGAIYQRAMQRIFDDMLHKMVECYVDDLVVKSKLRTDHLGHLRKVFNRLRKFQLKMNPLKYLSPLRKAYLHLHLSTWESPECVSLFLRQKSQPLVMCRAVLEPQPQVFGALAFHHGSLSTPPLNPLWFSQPPLWSTALCFISWICLSTLPLKEETLSAGVSFSFSQISFQTPAIMAIYFDMKESALGRIET